jgi:hypothetical protein
VAPRPQHGFPYRIMASETLLDGRQRSAHRGKRPDARWFRIIWPVERDFRGQCHCQKYRGGPRCQPVLDLQRRRHHSVGYLTRPPAIGGTPTPALSERVGNGRQFRCGHTDRVVSVTSRHRSCGINRYAEPANRVAFTLRSIRACMPAFTTAGTPREGTLDSMVNVGCQSDCTSGSRLALGFSVGPRPFDRPDCDRSVPLTREQILSRVYWPE